MNIRLLFFGATAAAMGSRLLDVSVTNDATPASIVENLKSEHPRLVSHRLLFAVNEEHADASRRLSDGDQLAIFTPVSGG